MVSVKITDNTKMLADDFKQKAAIFLRLMADEITKLAEPNTPKKTGRMRMDITKSVVGLHGEIHWGKYYAFIQETTQFKNYTTPGTGPHFAENAFKAGIDRTTEVAKRAGLI